MNRRSQQSYSEGVREAAVTLKDVKTADWKARVKAIHWLGEIVKAEGGRQAVLAKLRKIAKPLNAQIRDLRSVIVREVCDLVSTLAETLRDDFASIAPSLTSTLLKVTGGGNKVIAQKCAKCMLSVVQFTQSPRTIKVLLKFAKSRSKAVRCNALYCVLALLENWEPQKWIELGGGLRHCVKLGIEDTVGETRKTAREAYKLLSLHAPDEAQALKASLDKRALSRLEHGTVIVKHASRKRFIARRGQTLFRQATDE